MCSVLKHRDPPSEVIYPPDPLCWLVDNRMQLNLLLIRVLMCVIKYITVSQLENTGAIHHFNWYPPQTTWVHHIPSVLSKLFFFQRGKVRGFFVFFIGAHSLTLWCVCLCVGACCVCVCTLLDCTYLDLCILCAMGCLRTAMWLLIIHHTSPMIPLLSVYWMVMCSGMQIQSARAFCSSNHT